MGFMGDHWIQTESVLLLSLPRLTQTPKCQTHMPMSQPFPCKVGSFCSWNRLLTASKRELQPKRSIRLVIGGGSDLQRLELECLQIQTESRSIIFLFSATVCFILQGSRVSHGVQHEIPARDVVLEHKLSPHRQPVSQLRLAHGQDGRKRMSCIRIAVAEQLRHLRLSDCFSSSTLFPAFRIAEP
jgi:hypothetical protein